MSHPKTVLVLTPGVGGQYFGELLVGITREITGAGLKLVVVETFPPAALGSDDSSTDPAVEFTAPISWSEVSGVVSIATAVGAAYLKRLRDAGKSVVLCSTRVDDFDAPRAMPDNHGGTFTAVEHLIGHGHTRIGFVGNLAERDVRDRHDAYVEALDTHGLVADPDLLFIAPDNREMGGVRAALDLIASRNRPSAIMVGTDRNALGLIPVLVDAGLSIPRDLAIMAFDNIEAGAFSVPALSSVNQRFDEVGALAGRLVLAQLRGEVVPDIDFCPPSPGLVVRDTCGCSEADDDSAPEGDRWLLDTSPALLRDELQDALCGALLTGDDVVGGPVLDAVLTVTRDAEGLLGSGDTLTAAAIAAFTASLHRLTDRPDTLRRITDAVTEYAERMNTVTLRTTGRTTASPRVAAALWKLQAGAFLRQTEATENALVEQYIVDAALLNTGSSLPGHLGWLAGTHVSVGLLALWDEDTSPGRLRIVGSYDPAGVLPDLVGLVTAPEHFPPAAFIGAAEARACIVLPVRSTDREWGFLAVIGQIGTASARDAYHHWAALLCSTLESQRLQEIVRRNALYDGLTGLPNRRLFLDRLDQTVALRHRSNLPFAVLFLDLDGFKHINDSFGHQMGDRVLTAVAARLQRELRTVDTGARFGGDEFAILLNDVEAADVLIVAERVQAALAELIDIDGHEFSITASLGIATSTIEYASAEDVLRDADTAMYHAKATERGGVSFFDHAMRERAVALLGLNAQIRRALQEKQFEVHYQPIVDVVTGRAERFEALVRWRHPERGLLLPDEFLPLMDEGGLIIELGHWIIDEVCRQLASWGPGVAGVSVNLSEHQFWYNGLLGHTLRSLRVNGLSASLLTFEITEGVMMSRPDVALRIMRSMHDAGLHVHLDGFGTGQSWLATLHRFPIDAFKIDRSFIRDVTSEDRTAAMVRVIVAMGKALGLVVVAEGVETQAQLDVLTEIGCVAAQGFLFMPAVTGDRALKLLGRDLRLPVPALPQPN